MSNLTETECLFKEIAKQTSGELTSVEVIAYVEVLSQSALTLAAGGKDYTVKPSVINSTLTVIFVYHTCFSFSVWSSAWTAVMLLTGLEKNGTAYNPCPFSHVLCNSAKDTLVLLCYFVPIYNRLSLDFCIKSIALTVFFKSWPL